MRILSFDAETDGLWGTEFAIGAVLMVDGEVTERFYARREDSEILTPWVVENVLPVLPPPTHNTYGAMLRAFAAWYLAHKPDAHIVTHMGYIVEAHLLRAMRTQDFIGEWDAPYPLYDVADFLAAAGHDPTSVDAYAAAHGIPVGKTHRPTDDAEVAARVYYHLRAPRPHPGGSRRLA